MTEQSILMKIAVLGGTGKEGSGLAMRWAKAGYAVIIGSRRAEKAQRVAAELNEKLGDDYIRGLPNAAAAAEGDLIVLTVPYSAHRATLEPLRAQLAHKILIDVTVPLQPPAVTTVHLPAGGAAALEAQSLLGPEVKVVAAFQNISARRLGKLEAAIDCDVLVCGDDDDAKAQALTLADEAGMRGLDAGPLANAVAVEALTPVLLYINKRYRAKGAGLRITGLDA